MNHGVNTVPNPADVPQHRSSVGRATFREGDRVLWGESGGRKSGEFIRFVTLGGEVFAYVRLWGGTSFVPADAICHYDL
jgi:hypothetical protein